MNKISHCCLIDGGSRPNVMSKIIMEELGLSCTNKNSRNMLAFNKQKQPTIGEIKDVTLVMCSHPEIRITCNIQIIDMVVRNYSIIPRRDWKSLIDGYYSMDGTHIIVPKGPKNIIVYKEEIIVPYIENLPQPSVNFTKDDLGIYSIFVKEETEEMNNETNSHDSQEIWKMFFDGVASQQGNSARIILQNDFEKRHTFSFRLNFLVQIILLNLNLCC